MVDMSDVNKYIKKYIDESIKIYKRMDKKILVLFLIIFFLIFYNLKTNKDYNKRCKNKYNDVHMYVSNFENYSSILDGILLKNKFNETDFKLKLETSIGTTSNTDHNLIKTTVYALRYVQINNWHTITLPEIVLPIFRPNGLKLADEYVFRFISNEKASYYLRSLSTSDWKPIFLLKNTNKDSQPKVVTLLQFRWILQGNEHLAANRLKIHIAYIPHNTKETDLKRLTESVGNSNSNRKYIEELLNIASHTVTSTGLPDANSYKYYLIPSITMNIVV
uniref:Uncharacterized protein n=1 Tax=Megaviridae environmental sample TaxID=1737588 RepID=A0A5J6VKT3_9VIRU|nr:MAG: hypothetical protein [Megaviridae environmental sample]